MIYQNELDKSISSIACYFVSLAFYRAWKGFNWTDNDLNYIFEICKQKGFIDTNNCIYNPQKVADMLGLKLIFRGKYYPDSYKVRKNDYIISCWKLSKDATSAHFCVSDNSGIYTKEHIIFDPWQGGSKTVREGACYSLRVFQMK